MHDRDRHPNADHPDLRARLMVPSHASHRADRRACALRRVELLITQRERNRWCSAVAAADPALLAADGEAGQVRPAAGALHARALRPRLEVLTDDLVNQPSAGMWRVGRACHHRHSGVPGYGGQVSIGQAGGGEQCPACGESDLRPYGNGSKWACPRCHFILPCCEGGELAGLPPVGRCSGAPADGIGRPSSR
jgi:hypothetical protein